jgi:hypothetical protein
VAVERTGGVCWKMAGGGGREGEGEGERGREGGGGGMGDWRPPAWLRWCQDVKASTRAAQEGGGGQAGDFREGTVCVGIRCKSL